MLKVALTGGLATGKTYCAGRFAARGVPVIDADELAREVVGPGSPALAAIADRFGPAYLTPSGELDRARLAAFVFADAAARRALEAIVHPEVYRRVNEWFAALAHADPPAPVGIADIPLLYETHHEGDFDRVVVVACTPTTQRARLRTLRGWTDVEIEQRLRAQWPIEEKRSRAHYVIWTEGTFEDTEREVERVWHALRRDAGLEAP